ncbi:MAG: xanthine dehydrogenase small subunit [Haliea sp.]|uniref:xanthine dehydrogenase small subunit n=1 Tax=Marinobacter salarius TaxID=1420917 RepID=UPI0032EE8C4E
MVRFLLNDKDQCLGGVSPHIMVLDFLREHLHHTGTKEGCASGDCGACTVVLGEAVDGRMRYRAINACITPAASLHGKQLLTVEHLRRDGKLHAVQQAMVDCHGSQCGFCTPGFVMSLFAYRKTHEVPERESVVDALGGNLCRCTGYRPILDAAVQMYEPPLTDQFSDREAETVAALRVLDGRSGSVELEGEGKRFFAPTTIVELAELLLKYPEARLIAGGTDLSLEFTQFLRETEVLVYTGHVRELLEIRETSEGLEIGAAATYSQCQDLLVQYFPGLREMLARLGSLQIRNQGTIGGNIGNASPIGDMPPALIALGAELVLRRGDASRRLPLEDYYIAYKQTVQGESEFIERIIVPKPDPATIFCVYKISKRYEDDISATCAAISVQLLGDRVSAVRVAFGGMAAVPARASHCEAALLGQVWGEDSVRAAMSALGRDFQPISDFRASADYRISVSQNLLWRFYLEATDPAVDVRVTHHAQSA